MSFGKVHLHAAMVAVAMAAGGANGGETRVWMVPANVDGLPGYLHIWPSAWTIHFPEAPSQFTMEVEFYKQGQLVVEPPKISLKYKNRKDRPLDAFRFAIQIIDLDYLRLPAGKPRHCRWRLNLEDIGGRGIGAEVKDIPKTVFDFDLHSGSSSSGVFPPPHRDEARFPVKWLMQGPPGKVRSENTPEKLIESNPDSDIVIVYVVRE